MTGEGKARITVVFLALFFFMLLDILSAILLPVRRNGSERRMKWSGFCFLVFLFFFFFLFPLPPTSSLRRLYFHGGPGVRGRQSRLGRHDSTFRPIPPFVRHTAVVLMEMVSQRSYSVRERKAKRQRKRVAGRERERGKCEVLLLRCPGKSGCIGSV